MKTTAATISMRNNKFYLAVLLLFCFSITNAQDTHYNTTQFGARSALMGGAVIGNVKDNTAVIYNPAGMGFIDSSTLTVNGNAYQMENITIFNAIGQKKDFKSSSLGSVPLFVGGMFSKPQNKFKIGYSITSAVDFNFKATARIDDNVNIVNDTESPGAEEFIGQSSINTHLSELVVGLAGGYRLNEHWAIGLSNLISFRSLSMNKATYSRFFLNTPGTPLVDASFVRNADYFNVRYVAKIGLNYQAKNFSAGVTFITPSANILGSGTIAADVLGNNILYKGSRVSLLANDRQVKLKSTYKSPFGVTGGVNFAINRSSFGIALQYFGSVGIYDMLRAAPAAFVRPADLNTSLGAEQFLRLKEGAKSVFNFGVGYEYQLKPNLVLTGSFRTNNSYYDKDLNNTVGIVSDVTSWNIKHYAAGVTFTKGRSKMSVGLLYANGKDDKREQSGNLDNPSEGNFLQGATTITKATYSSVGLLLAYTFMLRK